MGEEDAEERDPRFWTVDEARAYLPRLRELLAVVRNAAHSVSSIRGNGHRSPPSGAASDELAAVLSELGEGDIVLRDPASGLIDFHARGDDGVVYFLCWRWGEEDLSWWHLPEEGFPGRKPLPRHPGAAG